MTWWNWFCYNCSWKGVAQELDQDYETDPMVGMNQMQKHRDRRFRLETRK